jgi:hypothetical protein
MISHPKPSSAALSGEQCRRRGTKSGSARSRGRARSTAHVMPDRAVLHDENAIGIPRKPPSGARQDQAARGAVR